MARTARVTQAEIRRSEQRSICERKATGRAVAFFYTIVLIAFMLTLRLGYLQIVRGPDLAARADAQHRDVIEIFARRGTIYDRDQTVLARSSPSESLYVDPHLVTNRTAEAHILAPLVQRPESQLADLFADTNRFQWIARKVKPELARRIQSLALPGVFVLDEDTGLRSHPSGRLASHILGFVNIDENGLDGLESAYDSLLRGTSGKKSVEVGDGSGPIPFGHTAIEAPAKPGRSLVLTIDSYLQYVTEHALRDGVRAFSARSGSAIVLDPWSGEILALANVPDFDPQQYWRFPEDARRDRAVADTYEPGSTFKLITAAAALENGIAPNARFPALDALTVGGATIHNAEDGMMAGGHGSESIEDIIAYSHNVGAAEIGLRVGPQAMYAMMRRFGFGEETNIELAGDTPGLVPAPSTWSGSSLPTMSFGHGLAITPLALARAYAAIANGGVLMRPRVISEILNPDGSLLYRYPPEIERRAISERTASVLRRYLRAVVVRGTGNPTAQVPGFTTAGKTGTAQVVENGVYASGAYIASFAGYIPADHPRFVIVVKVERPRGSIYGSQVAAPIFTKIAREAMIHVGVMPHLSASPSLSPTNQR